MRTVTGFDLSDSPELVPLLSVDLLLAVVLSVAAAVEPAAEPVEPVRFVGPVVAAVADE